ncbi:hypothetical protein ABW286_13180 [Erwinia papayae]|uniref:Type IV secretion protein Rhs n=1 Tax=Erwinia papayae TaxID=206499 RepID=A0ABV3N2T6_9GAMM
MSADEKESRGLTSGEIILAKSIFKNAINYSVVKIYKGSYFPFTMQNQDTAVTPDGNIYFMPKHYQRDFSRALPVYQHWFIHEMTHVWQYQSGLNVKIRGLVSWAVSYRYSLPNHQLISDYGI